LECEEPVLASVTAVAKEFARCRLDLGFVQEVRGDKVRNGRTEIYAFLYAELNENHQF
jgi:hypothetical protein